MNLSDTALKRIAITPRQPWMTVAFASCGLAGACICQAAAPAQDEAAKSAAQSESAAASQPAPGSRTSTSSETTDLIRVEVTASKRRQSLRDTAASVSAVQGAALEAAGAKDMEAVFMQTPGVQTNKGDPNQSSPTIRGVGTVVDSSALGFQQATTGIYIQDVPFTDPVGFVATPDLAPFDLDRVEVLRGPQGALYGSASLGGAVRYLVNQPDLKATQFSVLSSVAGVSHGGIDKSVYVMANMPVVPGSGGLRVVAFDRNDSGYIHNLGTGRDEANTLHQAGGRVIGAWQIAPGTRLGTMFMSQKSDIADSFAVSPDPARLEISTPTASPRNSKFSLGNVQLDVAIGDDTFTSNTGYIEKENNFRSDFSRRAGDFGPVLGLPSLPVLYSAGLIGGRAVSQEFRIASPSTGALNYVAGAFFQRSTFKQDLRVTAPGGAALWGDEILPGDSFGAETDDTVAHESAIFADGDYRISEAWSIGLGGRYYRNNAHYAIDSRLVEPLLGAVEVAHSFRDSGFTPKASLKYRFGENMWYALASKGYRFGGVNAGSGKPYDSDQLWNYETGLKLSPARNVNIDVTAFYLDWKDAQVNARQGGELPSSGIANVGKVKITGLELAAQWKPLEALQLGATIAATNARTVTPFTSNSGAAVPAGTRMPGTAKLQSFLQASYLFAGPAETSGRFSLTHAFTGQRTLSIDSGGVAAAFGQLDARMAFSTDRWELGFFIANATDKRGISGGAPVQTFGGSSYTDYYLIKPRTIGASLRFDM